MADQLKLRSREQILGDLIRTILINTDLTDVSPGSTLATLLEAIASSQFQIEVSALKILESANLESLNGADLDRAADSMKIPNGAGGYGRKPASQATGTVKIGSSFQKVSSKLYAGKPAPYAGITTLYLERADGFPASGQIYIGRNTLDRFEGPINYTSVTNNGSFWVMTLSTPVTKSHLHSDLITLAQGGDRVVPAGTIVQIPPNSESPAVSFITATELVIPDGEAEGYVGVVCQQFGEIGNALAGSITEFSVTPFPGATVTNTTSFVSGKSAENDEDLRQRIKAYPATLSRGTNAAILSAIIGATDPTTGRTIQSASILDPVEPGEPARGFLDDGTGLEPEFDSQPYESLLQNASGQESRFRVAQFPVTPCAVEAANLAPYALDGTMYLTVKIDEISETYYINPSNYKNINSATAYEVVRDLNSQSNLVGFRTIDGGKRIVAISLSGTAEIMEIKESNLQKVLGFPLATIRPIFLYQNSELKSFRGVTATLETRPKNQWSLSETDLTNVRVKVDGVIQTFTITSSDFIEWGTSIPTATISQWATVFSRKIAGVKFTVSGQVLVWSTWQTFSGSGSLEILEERGDGTPAPWIGDNKIWKPVTSGGVLSTKGAEKDFKFNRLTGEISLTKKTRPGDIIEVGSRNTRAFIRSEKTETGKFSLAPVVSSVGNARIIMSFDGDGAVRKVTVSVGDQITPTEPDPTGAKNIIRLTSNSVDTFLNAKIDDWIYLSKDASAVPLWGSKIQGLYKIRRRGNNIFAQNQTYNTIGINTQFIPNVQALTKDGSDIVTVADNDHGLKTGDLITVSTTAAIGGISAANLSVTDVPIVVLDKDYYQFQAAAAATSTASGYLDGVGTNVIKVTHTNHGFKTNSLINTTALSPAGGISAANLSVSQASITVLDAGHYEYRASSAATSAASGSLSSIVYIADTWVEIEISSDEYTDWSAILGSPQNLTPYMVYIFRSTTTPQIVDFGGSVSDLTVDEIVDIINGQIVSGAAEKISPQQFQIRSNDYKNGTVAILAAIGSASSVIETGVAKSAQAHTAYSSSREVQGSVPVVQAIVPPTAPSAGYPTRTYMKIDKDLTNVLDNNTNPTINAYYMTSTYPVGFQHLWITGKQAGISARVYNNQTGAPFTGFVRGSDTIKLIRTSDTTQTSPDSLDRYANYGIRLTDMPVNNYDRLIIEMDLNPADKTVAINMAKLAKIQDIDAITGYGKGQVISFRLKDPDDGDKPFFDSSSVFKDFNFEDFKILTKNVGLYRENIFNDVALVLRSVAFGSPARLRLSIRLPEQPDQSEFVVTHTTDYYDGDARINLIVSLPSKSLISGSTLSTGTYKVRSVANGQLFDWYITSGALNAGLEYQPNNVLNISGAGQLAGSYFIQSAQYRNYVAVSAATTAGSNIVVCTVPGHQLANGDLATIATSASIGGISSLNLSVANVPITYIDANTFSYPANAQATSTDSGTINSITSGLVVVKAPGSGGLSPEALFEASSTPISTWELDPKTYQDLATAVNNYLPDNPVATAEAIGVGVLTNPIAKPTYMVYPNSTPYSGDDILGAFNWHCFSAKMSGAAGIWQYDSSNPSFNGIKATVQTDDPIFPTISEASGTAYSPINEEVCIIPTNTATLSRWLAFKASSSLNILAKIDRIQSDNIVQISSKSDGSDGAIKISGVTANAVSAAVVGNASSSGGATKISILSSSAKSLVRGSFIKLKNSISSEILRAYRVMPTGSGITNANTTDINNYFRATNSVKYIKLNATTARIIFLREGQGPSQTEPLTAGDQVVITNLGGGLVQFSTTAPVKLLGRVGDMMYISPTSAFPADVRCKEIPASGFTQPNAPEYIGYPVVHVIDEQNLIVIAPNITSFGATIIGSSTDLVFMPAIWNEKNIRTNHKEGAKFDEIVNNNKMFYLIKTLPGNLMSIWAQNSASEATDTMLLDTMSVSTDDYVILGDGFDPANTGTFRIVAHNGRNHIIAYNPGGGKDELVDVSGLGSKKWQVGPIETGYSRPIRIISGDSVKLGDRLRISAPSDSAQWFNFSFFGTWEIVGIGYSAFNFTGPLPHSYTSGSLDYAQIAPYVDIVMPSAPAGILDSNGNYVDKFVIGGNKASIGFVEKEPLEVIRMVSGHAVNPQNPELSDVFLTPGINTSKFSNTFGTSLTAIGKLGFIEQTFQGIDGYKIFSGLVREAHRIVDGLPKNTVLYPGVKAAGSAIEWLTPLIKSVSIELKVKPKDGVTLNSITDLIKSAVAGYVNSLGVGRPIVLSEIIRIVQGLPGVFSVSVVGTLPAADEDRIVVSQHEKAFVLDVSQDIIVG